jgi:hypothetical protein
MKKEGNGFDFVMNKNDFFLRERASEREALVLCSSMRLLRLGGECARRRCVDICVFV